MGANESESEVSASLGASTATSPSPSTSSLPDFKEAYSRAFANMSSAALDVVSDLSNYIPLGCLCFEDFTNATNIATTSDLADWQDVTTPPFLAFDTATSTHLARLIQHGWIRMQSNRCQNMPSMIVFRIYLLAWDVGKASIERTNKQLLLAAQVLVGLVDTSGETWSGRFNTGYERKFDQWATRDEDDSSLFYLFNRLESPNPDPSLIEEKYAREALEDLLDRSSSLPGLNTPLYPYQRRSAGAMLSRESVPQNRLDPRMELRTAPDGTTFYYKPREMQFLRDPEYCESCRGGILAETMGLGKTLICLSLILATKGQPPKVPVQYSATKTRPRVGSLADMAVNTINTKSIPWRVEFDRIRHASGHELASCAQKLEQAPPLYEIPVVKLRWNRATTQPPPQRMLLTATSLIVVPQNLCKQWQSEIAKHVDSDALKVLVMDQPKKVLPCEDELRKYDVILFTRSRFDQESNHGKDAQGRSPGRVPPSCQCSYIGASRKRDCHCPTKDNVYHSPLKGLHFKRLIVDEGHFFSNSNTNTTIVANGLVTADHKWSVSGTPARDLLGVEVDISILSEGGDLNRDDMLERRQHFSKEDRSGAIESLGSLAAGFLRAAPWSDSTVSWKDHVFRHEGRSFTYSGFSKCLRSTLENLVIKTRPEDVEKDIELPPLHHKIVRLEPSFYDKLSANMFTLVLTANAVTSERSDADYLFHKSSYKERYQLVSNLRQSAFFWTGFSESDVYTSIKNSTGYLEKEATSSSVEDRRLLTEALSCTVEVLASEGWKCMSRCHEIGIFVDCWPATSASHWSFDSSREPLLTGITQLLEAQKFINYRLDEFDPGEGLSGAGIKALAPARRTQVKMTEGGPRPTTLSPIKRGLPASSIEPDLRRRQSPKLPMRVSKNRQDEAQRPRSSSAQSRIDRTSSASSVVRPVLPADSEYAKAHVVGTTSAKLSYLLSQISKHHRREKILVFYSGDNVAYYLAQALELLDIKHEIYAKSLQQRLKSEYIVKFDQGSEDRVLLMDVGQAAYGLNLSSASRIFFVNPVCRPNVEAQAIKRAHRIGQTKEVFVETLVLKDTIEEKMLERSCRMTPDEHREANHLEDDGGIREIIQSARILPISVDEKAGRQMAPLDVIERLWGREDRCTAVSTSRKRKQSAMFEDQTNHEAPARVIHEEEPQPIVKRLQGDALRPALQLGCVI